MEYRKILRTNLLRLLREKGMYKRTLCDRIGMSYQSLWRFMNQEGRFNEDHLEKIADALNVPLYRLFLNQDLEELANNRTLIIEGHFRIKEPM